MKSNPQQFGKYKLQQPVGRGTVGEVWKAFDTQVGGFVAIKILHPDLWNDPNFMTRFEHEKQVLSSLNHPNIVGIHDFCVSTEPSHAIAYIVTDYIEGQTLTNYIRNTSGKKQFPSSTDIVHLFTSIGNAIDYAHQKGVICCNIKPANILIDERRTAQNPMGTPVLTDPGMASAFRVNNATSVETALYTAPEQAQGYAGNEYSDIYSLGVMLYEICTGVPPFRGDSPTAILSQHVNAAPTPPALLNPYIPPALAVVILRCLAKDPATRFNDASSMVTALAEAFDLSVPEQLNMPRDDIGIMSEPTYYKPLQTNPSLGKPLSLAGNPSQATGSAPLLIGNPPTPQPASPPLNTPLLSATGIAESTPVNSFPASSAMQSSPSRPVTSPQPLLTPPPTPKRRRRGLLIALIVMAIAVVSGAILSVLYLLPKQSPAAASPIIGHAYFISSETLQENIDIKSMDELLIDLHGIQPPAPGKNYYAWLLGDKSNSKIAPILLATLSVTRGSVHYLYQDKQHTNLFAIASRLLITEEDANQVPGSPSKDTSTWRFYAELSQAPANGTTAPSSYLDHLRGLLVADPQLDTLGLKGGLDAWQIENIGKILEWAASARDYWKTQGFELMRNQFIRILDYLDGAAYVQIDVPPNTRLLLDPKVALLEFDPQTQVPPGYQANIASHLQGLLNAPGVSDSERSIITQINTEMDHVTDWLKQVRQYARQLVHMTNTQWGLRSTLDLLDSMATQALYAYIGRLAPDTDQIQGGAVQIGYDLQSLTNFDISPYNA